MNLTNITLNGRNKTKKYILYDPISIKFKNRKNSARRDPPPLWGKLMTRKQSKISSVS